MRYFSKFLGVSAALMLFSATVAGAEEKDPLKPSVPPDQIAEAKQMKNPVANTPENIAKGKALVEGKGTCFNGSLDHHQLRAELLQRRRVISALSDGDREGEGDFLDPLFLSPRGPTAHKRCISR